MEPSSSPNRKTIEGAAVADSFSPPAPAIALPKGGGAIRGIGERFSANPVTGSATVSIPLPTSPGRSGFGPQLSLSYDSGSGNGPFGMGWRLAVPAIARKTDKGLPRYRDADETDEFLLSGADDLVPVRAADGTFLVEERAGHRIQRYRPRVEGGFLRIERWTHLGTRDVHWRTISPDNVTTLFGDGDSSRVADPSDRTRVFSWWISAAYDDKGNAIVYEYRAESSDGVRATDANEAQRSAASRSANRYLKRVKYGNRISRLVEPDLSRATWLFELVLDYGEGHLAPLPAAPGQPQLVQASPVAGEAWPVRPDSFSVYRAGFEVRTYRRCHRALMFHRFAELGDEPCLVRSTTFEYDDLAVAAATTTEEELAHPGSTRFVSRIRAATQSGYVRDAAPAVIRDGVTYTTYRRQSLPPVALEYSLARIEEAVDAVPSESVENLPIGIDRGYRWLDLDGEGAAGVLTEQGRGWFYKRNETPLGDRDPPVVRLGPVEELARVPSLRPRPEGRVLMDLDGNGRFEVVDFDGPTPTWSPQGTPARACLVPVERSLASSCACR